VDIAKSRDYCVASLWFDGVKVAEHTWRPAITDSAKMMSIADKIVELATEWGRKLKRLGWDGSRIPASRISGDAIGMGEGVWDRLSQMGMPCNRIDFGAAPKGYWPELTRDLEFPNIRSELHWVYRRALQEGLARLPKKWQRSWEEAQWPHYDEVIRHGRTQVVIEKKEDIRDRHGRSPDHLDADLYAWARPGRTRPRFTKAKEVGRKRRSSPGLVRSVRIT